LFPLEVEQGGLALRRPDVAAFHAPDATR
jgi:hypothetical protein